MALSHTISELSPSTPNVLFVFAPAAQTSFTRKYVAMHRLGKVLTSLKPKLSVVNN